MDLTGLVSSAVEDIRMMAQEHSIQVTLDAPSTPLWVRGDQQRLRQVLLILGDNACHYSNPDSQIEIKPVRLKVFHKPTDTPNPPPA